MAPFMTEAVEAVWGQKIFIYWIMHKIPLLRKPLSIRFWQICQNIWSSQITYFTLCQNLMVDPVCHAIFLSHRLTTIEDWTDWRAVKPRKLKFLLQDRTIVQRKETRFPRLKCPGLKNFNIILEIVKWCADSLC